MEKLWGKTVKTITAGVGTIKRKANGTEETDEEFLEAKAKIFSLESRAVQLKSTIQSLIQNIAETCGTLNVVGISYADDLKALDNYSSESQKLHDTTASIVKNASGEKPINGIAREYVYQPLEQFISESRRLIALISKRERKLVLLDSAKSSLESAQQSGKAEEISKATLNAQNREAKFERCNKAFIDGVANLEHLRVPIFDKCLNGYRYIISQFIEESKNALAPITGFADLQEFNTPIDQLHPIPV